MKDVELDIQELKCLIQSISTDTNPVLKVVAKRSTYQMREWLDALTVLLNVTFMITLARRSAPTAVKTDSGHKAVAGLIKEVPVETVPVQDDEVSVPQTLAERMKPATNLCHAINLNDPLRFICGLPNGDMARMNEIVEQLGKASSLEEAMSVFASKVQPDEEGEAVTNSVELFRKYFS